MPSFRRSIPGIALFLAVQGWWIRVGVVITAVGWLTHNPALQLFASPS